MVILDVPVARFAKRLSGGPPFLSARFLPSLDPLQTCIVFLSLDFFSTCSPTLFSITNGRNRFVLFYFSRYLPHAVFTFLPPLWVYFGLPLPRPRMGDGEGTTFLCFLGFTFDLSFSLRSLLPLRVGLGSLLFSFRRLTTHTRKSIPTFDPFSYPVLFF